MGTDRPIEACQRSQKPATAWKAPAAVLGVASTWTRALGAGWCSRARTALGSAVAAWSTSAWGGIGVVVQKCGVIVGMGDLLEVELHLSGGPVLLQGVVVRVSPDLEKDQRVGLSFIRGVLYESAYVPMAMYLVELDRRGAGSSPMGAPAGRAAAGLIAGLAKRRL